MQLDQNDKALISGDVRLRDVLSKLDLTGMRIVFVVDEKSRVVGVITDGDVRRALLSGATLETLAREVMNKSFVSLSHTIQDDEAQSHLSDRISVIPMLTDDGCLDRIVYRKEPTYIPAAEPVLAGNEMAYVVDCLKSGWISSQGIYVRSFEEAFASYTGTRNALAVSNGTVALQLALDALCVGAGDEVIVPDLTFAATLNAVLHVGAAPVIVDVEPVNLTMDMEAVRAAITPRTKAIMPVHLYGQMCDMATLRQIADQNKLLIIEDAAEALGSRYDGKHAGTIGDAGTFSFFANKLITTGEGGMVVFKDAAVAERARMLRDHGMDPTKRYWHLEAGYNFRLTNLQSAIGLAQLERVEQLLSDKLRLARTYREHLLNLEGAIILPQAIPNSVHSYWNFVVLFRHELGQDVVDRVIEFMRDRHIDARRLFYPMHVMPPYKALPRIGDCPNSKNASARGIAFPSSPKLTEAQITDICITFRQAVEMLDVARMAEQHG